jgi:hypothetical protein
MSVLPLTVPYPDESVKCVLIRNKLKMAPSVLVYRALLLGETIKAETVHQLTARVSQLGKFSPFSPPEAPYLL